MGKTYLGSDWAICNAVYNAMHMPKKPGDMTRKQREAYFAEVRKHADALVSLLADTRFDRDPCSDVDLDTPDFVRKYLSGWGEETPGEGLTVAFQVYPSGEVTEHHYTYPDGALTDTLERLLEWTRWDDQWDGAVFSSSAPLVQANGKSKKTIYFNCMLYERLSRAFNEFPFAMLATIANVALELSLDEQVDEETARRQVRRYQERVRKERDSRPYAFGDPDDVPPDFEPGY
jgi:hypothetical protein